MSFEFDFAKERHRELLRQAEEQRRARAVSSPSRLRRLLRTLLRNPEAHAASEAQHDRAA